MKSSAGLSPVAVWRDSSEQLAATVGYLGGIPVKVRSQQEEFTHSDVETPEIGAQAVREPVLRVVDHSAAGISQTVDGGQAQRLGIDWHRT
jgi:hypothetical protein